MTQSLDQPGAALVVLQRLATSTDVMLVSSPHRGAVVPSTGPGGGKSQWALVEDLLLENRLDEIERLYASTLTVHPDDAPLGVFVAFVSERMDTTSSAGEWVDLREACRDVGPAWAGALSEVRERFVARAPDESLRLR